MAKFKPAPLFQTVSGALNRIDKKSPHAADEKMVLTTHRVAPTKTKNGCLRVYLRGLENVTRKTPYSAAEQANKATFAQVSAQVQARRKESSPTYESDYAAFLAQRNSKNGEPTFVSYLWKVVKETI